METRLGIEHLAPYLPYGLKVSDIDTLNYGTGVGGIDHILTTRNKKYKPRLIPLEKFKDINSKEMEAINEIWSTKLLIRRMAIGDSDYSRSPYDLVQICFKHHIDIFNLIPQGLAVEK